MVPEIALVSYSAVFKIIKQVVVMYVGNNRMSEFTLFFFFSLNFLY